MKVLELASMSRNSTKESENESRCSNKRRERNQQQKQRKLHCGAPTHSLLQVVKTFQRKRGGLNNSSKNECTRDCNQRCVRLEVSFSLSLTLSHSSCAKYSVQENSTDPCFNILYFQLAVAFLTSTIVYYFFPLWISLELYCRQAAVQRNFTKRWKCTFWTPQLTQVVVDKTHWTV